MPNFHEELRKPCKHQLLKQHLTITCHTVGNWGDNVYRPDYSETFEFELGTAVGGGDAARLWIDGAVVIDGFERGSGTVGDWEGGDEGLGGGGRGYVNLTAGTLHDIYVEYRYARPAYVVSFTPCWTGSTTSLALPQACCVGLIAVRSAVWSHFTSGTYPSIIDCVGLRAPNTNTIGSVPSRFHTENICLIVCKTTILILSAGLNRVLSSLEAPCRLYTLVLGGTQCD